MRDRFGSEGNRLVVKPDRTVLGVGQTDFTMIKAGEYLEILSSDMPDYEGSYEANALFSEQVFPTMEKVMRSDFTVHAINYTEAPNESGITVTIGG